MKKIGLFFCSILVAFNVEGNVRNTIDIKGYLCDSENSEIRCKEKDGVPVLTHFEGQLENVSIH